RWAPAPCSAVSSRRFTRTHAPSTSPRQTISRPWKKVCVLDLSGKVAIVTGASRGIGRGVAMMLASRGAHVVAAARGDHAASPVADIHAAGQEAGAVPLEVSDSAPSEAMIAHGRGR